VGGEIYNIYERPPKVEGVCDADRGELVQRPDDREEVIGPRLQAYEKQTAPLVAYYGRLGLLHVIDASKSVDEVGPPGAAKCAERARGAIAGPKGSWYTTMAIHLRSAEELGKDAPRRASRARDLDLAAKRGKAGNFDDGPRKACRGKKSPDGRARRHSRDIAGYPCVLCTSVNSEIVTGFHRRSASCAEGDIVSIDFGMEVHGYYADSAVTVPVGQIRPELRKLLDVTRESLDRAIDKMRAGNRLGDVGPRGAELGRAKRFFGGA